jgi:hypothetical protein
MNSRNILACGFDVLLAGADGEDGWKKLVYPLKLWRMELFKYMSVG